MKKLIAILSTIVLLGACNLDKTTFIYYSSGNLAQVLHYTGSSLNGTSVRFFDNDSKQVWEQIDFVANQKHGKWYKWYENGNLQSEDSYAQDTPHGISREFWENGNLKLTKNYENGVLHGRMTQFDRDGKPASITYYHQGVAGEVVSSGNLASIE